MIMAFSTTITQEYWSLKMRDYDRMGYFIEYKEDTRYWQARLPKLQEELDDVPYISGVFLVGSKPMRVRVLGVRVVTSRRRRLIPDRYAGAISTQAHWEITCDLMEGSPHAPLPQEERDENPPCYCEVPHATGCPRCGSITITNQEQEE